MKNKIIYKNFIPKKYLNKKYSKKINQKFKRTLKNINENLNYAKDATHSFSKNFNFNFSFKQINKFKKFKTVVVIGMGGSSLGSEAIYHFLKYKIKKHFIFLNNLDESTINDLKKNYDLKKILFFVISKSGNTVETISNLISLKILKNKSKNIILISKKNNNPLYSLSKKLDLFFVEHKNYISGRFSVLSEVGLLPAYLMGINIKHFRKNLLTNLKLRNNKFLEDSSKKMANIIKSKKLKTIIFLNYLPSLDKFLCWNQQLLAESLGKKEMGLLPVISSAPKDHHSLLQLYLDGPKDKIFYIFSSDDGSEMNLNSKIFGSFFKFLNNKSLGKIKKSQKIALIKTLKRKNIPFRVFSINSNEDTTIGELFSYFMLETILIARLTNINPFDQPAIEQVKNSTKKILS